MKWNKWMYLVESSSTERYQLALGGIYIHMKRPKPVHEALCSRGIRNFITKDKSQVTCEECKKLLK